MCFDRGIRSWCGVEEEKGERGKGERGEEKRG